MGDDCRRSIRKAKKCGVVVYKHRTCNIADDYHTQLTDVFAKQQLIPTYGIERVRALIQRILPTGMLLLLRARDPEGHCIATGIFLIKNDRMYFWGGPSWRTYQHLHPNEPLMWAAMQYGKAHGARVLDLGGGAGHYKKKYGGYPIACHGRACPVLQWLLAYATRPLSYSG
jgi:lipid II:glycine glycyltransferase (peptidoglycan interpeptide bridge formation enzyme)